MDQNELEKQVEQVETNINENKKTSKKSVVKYIINIAIVLTGTFLAIFLSLKDNFNEIIENLKTMNLWYLFLIIGLMISVSLLKAMTYFCFARLYTKNYKYHQGLVIDQVGIFYNAVTPGASGGQIMQAYTLKRQGIQISNAVSIMAMWSIVFQSVLIIYGMVAFFVEFDTIMAIDHIVIFELEVPILLLTIIGFILNVSVIGIVLLMGYWKGFHNFIMGPCINLGYKLRIIRDPDKSRESLRVQVENFKIELRRLLTNIPVLALVTILIFSAMTVKFSIPYFVGEALGNESEVASFWSSVMLSNYHQMVTGCIPIPGSAGVSELVFKSLFLNENSLVKGFFYTSTGGLDACRSLCLTALLMWRSITFTIPLIIAGIVSAFYRPRHEHVKERSKDILSRETFVSLQKETYVDRLKEVEQLEKTSELTLESIKNRLKALNKKDKADKTKQDNNKKNVDTSDFDKLNIDDGDDSI